MLEVSSRPKLALTGLKITTLLITVGLLSLAQGFSSDTRHSSTPTVAAIEFAPIAGEPEHNKQQLTNLIIKAARRGARYVVLPELSLIGPLNRGEPQQTQMRFKAETVPGPTTEYFAKCAKDLGISIVISLAEKADDNSGYFLTTVLLNENGEIIARYRKVMVRLNREDGSAKRGSYRDTLDTVDDRGLRLGIIAGDDIQVGVPRLAERGADTILITAGWGASDPVKWDKLCCLLSRQHSVNLVVANRQFAGGPVHSETGSFSGIYTRQGAVFRPDKTVSSSMICALLPERNIPWRIESSLGLPSVPSPSGEPLSFEIAELGRALFFDKGLSSDGKVSCSTCHQPQKAFANGEEKGTGVYGRNTKRNVPSLLNVAFRPLLQWDGYASTLENFAKYPISGYTEMDFHYLDRVVAYVVSQPYYVKAFRSAFGAKEIQFDDVARALSTYERTLISGNSPFDRYYYGGDKSALSESALRGLGLFTGKADCSKCHLIGNQYALFLDLKYHALGVGFNQQRGTYDDIGLGGISTDDSSGLFQTPSLRNVAETSPYMHDGSIKTLEEVVEFFNRGGIPSPHRTATLKPLFLNEQEKKDVVEFLRSLSGDQRFSSHGERLKGQAPSPH